MARLLTVHSAHAIDRRPEPESEPEPPSTESLAYRAMIALILAVTVLFYGLAAGAAVFWCLWRRF